MPRSARGSLLSDALVARMSLAAFSLLTVAMVTRAVGPDTYGVYATATGLTFLLAFLTDLGASSVVVREGIQRDDYRRAGRTYLQVRIALIGLSLLVGAALVPIALPAADRAAGWTALALLAFVGPNLISPLGQLHGTMRAFRTSVVVQGVAQLGLTGVVLLAVDDPTAVQLVAATVGAAAIATVVALVLARPWVESLRSGVDWPALVGMLRSISLLGAAGAVSLAYARIDGVLLLNLAGQHDAGVYAAAYRFLDQTAMVPVAFLIPIAPVIAEQLSTRSRVSHGTDRALLRIEVLGGIGLSFVIIGTAPWVAAALLGPAFTESGVLLGLLAVCRSWSLLAYIATTKVVHARHERRYLAIAVCGLAINVATNLVLIPEHGAKGAAIATVLTEAVTVVAFCFASRGASSVVHLRSWLGMLFAASAAFALTRVAAEAGVWPELVVSLIVSVSGAWMLWRATAVTVSRVQRHGRAVG